MDIRFVTAGSGEVVAVMAGEGGELFGAGKALDSASGGRIAKAMKAAGFKGGAGQVVDVLAPDGVDFSRVLVIGVGKAEAADGMGVERWAGHAVKRTLTAVEKLVLQPDALPGVAIAEAGAHAAMGARLASYRFDTYRTKLKPEQKPTLQAVEIVLAHTAAAKARAEVDAAIVEGVFFARDLVSEPPNVLYPESFAERLRDLETIGVEVEILEPTAMEKLGMGALLGVAQGSARPARLVAMKWNGSSMKKQKPFAIVGKGVTFDTGGISLKPGAGMDEMKGDMGGAAAVAGAMKAIALRKAKANVVGIVALVENMPGSNAQRPGDIVNTMSGQTIEVLNTDAEGRLILADAVWYAQDKYDPVALVDLATLTGAVIVALGHEHAGMCVNDEDLAHAISAAGAAEGELVWRLPLSAAYDKLIDTPNADMKNIAGKPVAGSIVGAQFIKRFVQDGTPWAHLDIAGTATKAGPYDDPLSPRGRQAMACVC
ncbi:MAG: leucyl aminopeptidase [Hyphomonadaceae bacterium JAD_PAG50586_4]|nr:MAG: leucyl aminopeptidase [Hyphomonadaceae bacterium JAD_PAG50586_4]